MSAQQEEGSRFTVDLGSVKLPAILEKQVETEIRDVVLRALGETEVATRMSLPRSIFDMFPGRTLGLWLDPEVEWPGQPGGPLVPADHTIIMREIMKHPLQVLKALGLSKGDQPPSGQEVLEAALDVEEIDPYTKHRIEAVLEILPKLDEARAKAPRSTQKAFKQVENEISRKSLPDMIQVLRSPDLRGIVNEDGGMAAGMEIAAEILQDGASSIYSPDNSFHRLLRSGRTATIAGDTFDGIATSDTIGATAGGAAGALIAGVGAAPGAVAGGAGASAGYAIAALVDWLWD